MNIDKFLKKHPTCNICKQRLIIRSTIFIECPDYHILASIDQSNPTQIFSISVSVNDDVLDDYITYTPKNNKLTYWDSNESIAKYTTNCDEEIFEKLLKKPKMILKYFLLA